MRDKVIYCLSPRIAKLFEVTIWTMPMWTFCATYFGFEHLRHSQWRTFFGAPLDILGVMLIFLAILTLCLAGYSRFVFQGSTFALPFRAFGRGLNSLRRVTLLPDDVLKARYLAFTFEENGGETTTQKISLAGFTAAKINELLSQIEKRAPECRISLKVRDYFSQKNKGAETSASFDFPYRSQVWARLKDALDTRRRDFVILWICSWTLIFVAMSPMVYLLLVGVIAKLLGHFAARSNELSQLPAPSWVFTYAEALTSWVNTYVGGPCNSVSGTARDCPSLSAGLDLGSLVAMSFVTLGKLAFNRLHISADSVRLYTKRMGCILRQMKVRWEDLQSVTLTKPRNSASSCSWQIHFYTGNNKLKPALRLKLSALEPSQQRALIEAIECQAPQSKIDATLLELFRTDHGKSYTELWLQSLSSAPKRERLTPLQEGQCLDSGRYVVLRQLAVGGQGTAYIAIDNAAKDVQYSQIVLKEFVLPVYVDKEVRRQALEKFQRESQTLKDLDHPQIVRLLNYFIEDHRAYLVLEHIEGHTLRNLVETQGPLLEEVVRTLAAQMCEILAYLHNLEPLLIHRDFTPDNLILGTNGILKLIDFDVARRDAASKTTVVGKHSFIPPEQFRGRPSSQSDIYAMGATLHFLLTGQDPEPLSKSVPSECGVHVSDDLNAIVMKATELDLQLRFKTATEIQDALGLSGHIIQVRERQFQ